ncbi:MAG: hypothetical protein PVH88_02040 [Ignavibacteria bacterium]|jgi:hypothetical protein
MELYLPHREDLEKLLDQGLIDEKALRDAIIQKEYEICKTKKKKGIVVFLAEKFNMTPDNICKIIYSQNKYHKKPFPKVKEYLHILF